MWITEFYGTPFKNGKIGYITDITEDTPKYKQFSAKFKWPNEMTPVKGSALGLKSEKNVMIVCDGFLVPTHTAG